VQSLKKIAILRGTIFAQISPFRAKSQFFANFALARNFSQICDLAGPIFSRSSQILQFARNLREGIYVFPLKFTFSVLGWRTINFCTNWAKIGQLS